MTSSLNLLLFVIDVVITNLKLSVFILLKFIFEKINFLQCEHLKSFKKSLRNDCKFFIFAAGPLFFSCFFLVVDLFFTFTQ